MQFNADGSAVFHGNDGDQFGSWTSHGLADGHLSCTVTLGDLTLSAVIYPDDPNTIALADENLTFQYMGQKD